jgi:hypothetical protein
MCTIKSVVQLYGCVHSIYIVLHIYRQQILPLRSVNLKISSLNAHYFESDETEG